MAPSFITFKAAYSATLNRLFLFGEIMAEKYGYYPRYGIIYIFETGVGMKIGKTIRPLPQRMKELSITHSLKFVHAIYCYDVITGS